MGELRLSASIKRRNDVLHVEYRVVNALSNTVYLTNHQVRMDPKRGQVPDRSVAFVKFPPGVQAVEISKKRPEPPQILVEEIRMHFVTPIGPGERFEEAFSLPLPLEEISAYPKAIPPGARKYSATLQSVYLVVGYMEKTPSIRAYESSFNKVRVHSIGPETDDSGEPLPMGPIPEKYLVSKWFDADVPVAAWR